MTGSTEDRACSSGSSSVTSGFGEWGRIGGSTSAAAHPLSDDAAPTAAIFDMDGTLCDVRSVRKYVEAPDGEMSFKRDFARFHRESADCDPHPRVQRAAQVLRDAGFRIIVVTGREARWADLTSQWLTKWGVDFDKLYLRPAGDYRADAEVKLEIGREILTTFAPAIAFDDRDDIAEVWQQLGVPTVKVTEDGQYDLIPDRGDPVLRTVAQILTSSGGTP